VIKRLDQFLPSLKASNEELQQRVREGQDVRIDTLSSEADYVAMVGWLVPF
jgi:benzoyl-CoA reductase/2-hydroxyglutaryl-CoA dehydratase subunit BcrC/BadD/HgdB